MHLSGPTCDLKTRKLRSESHTVLDWRARKAIAAVDVTEAAGVLNSRPDMLMNQPTEKKLTGASGVECRDFPTWTDLW